MATTKYPKKIGLRLFQPIEVVRGGGGVYDEFIHSIRKGLGGGGAHTSACDITLDCTTEFSKLKQRCKSGLTQTVRRKLGGMILSLGKEA